MQVSPALIHFPAQQQGLLLHKALVWGVSEALHAARPERVPGDGSGWLIVRA